MTSKITSYDLAAVLRTRMEQDSKPARIIKCLDPYDGQPLTSEFTLAIRQAAEVPSLRIRGMLGPTYFEWTERLGVIGTLLIADSVDSAPVIINIAGIVNKNAADLAARELRNRARSRVLEDPDLMAECAEAINAFKQAEAKLNRLLSYPEPLYHDAFALKEAFEFGFD